jgi:20S proteasome subunit alpha 2
LEFPFFSSKIFIVNKKIGIGGSGLSQDLRILIKRARRHAEIFKYNFGEDISLRQLVRDLASFIQEFTQSGGVRPFGISIFVVGFENDGPNLYQIEPSGIFLKIKVNALGFKSKEIKNFLKKRKVKNLNLKEGFKLIFKILEKTSDSKINEKNLQMAYVNSLCIFNILNSNNVLNLIKKKII